MLAIRRILFSTDFSEGSLRAFPQAAFLAERHDAELHIVNVREDGASETDGTFPVPADTLTDWLQGAAEDAVDLEALSVEQEQINSDAPAEAICTYADDRDIDLVVMGTHGRRGTDRLIFGSVAEDVVRASPCPVFTVRTEADEAPSEAVERVLAPIDFSEHADESAQHASGAADVYDADIHLFHVVEVPDPPPPHIDPDNFPEAAVLDQAKLDLEKIADAKIGHDRVTVAAKGGDPSETILEYVDEHDIGLIVIGTKGRTGLDRMLIGSVAEQVLRRAPAPVLVIKPERKSLVSASDSHASESEA